MPIVYVEFKYALHKFDNINFQSTATIIVDEWFGNAGTELKCTFAKIVWDLRFLQRYYGLILVLQYAVGAGVQ